MIERFNKRFLELAGELPFSSSLVFCTVIVTEYFAKRDDKMIKSQSTDSNTTERFAELEQRLSEVDDKASRAIMKKEFHS